MSVSLSDLLFGHSITLIMDMHLHKYVISHVHQVGENRNGIAIRMVCETLLTDIARANSTLVSQTGFVIFISKISVVPSMGGCT